MPIVKLRRTTKGEHPTFIKILTSQSVRNNSYLDAPTHSNLHRIKPFVSLIIREHYSRQFV